MEAHPLQTGAPGRLYRPHDRVTPILDANAAFHRGFTRQDMYAVYKAGGTRAVDAVLSNEELLRNRYWGGRGRKEGWVCGEEPT